MSEQSTSALERDAERTRADIADTADQLKSKMSPGQMMDEVTGYLKDGDVNKLFVNLKDQVRDNPLALALVGSGLAWLMMGSGTQHTGSTSNGHVAAATPARQPTGRVAPTPAQPGGSAAFSSGFHADRPNTGTTSGTSGTSGGGIGESAASMKKSAASAAGSVGGAVSSAAHTASDAVGSAAEAANRSMHDLRDSASEQMSHATHAGAEMGQRIKSSFLDALEREPLVIGALGLAVGAAIGAMVPVTRTEQENFGEASRHLRKDAESALADGVEKAKGVAGDVYAAARDEADRQGLTPGDKPLASKVSDVAKAAGAEAKQAADRAVDKTEQSVDRATDGYKPAPRR